MIIALLIAAASAGSPATALEAENAFVHDAKRIGQWTAFRKWADRDAVMFTPQAVWARNFLKPLKDPPNAISWRPVRSYVSCDGRTAINTGPWFKQDGSLGGSFTTVWQRTEVGWRWVYDGGGPLSRAPGAAKPRSYLASCAGRAPGPPVIPPLELSPRKALTTPEDSGRGQAADRTLGWDWKVLKGGSRRFRAYQWNGTRYVEVLSNEIPAPRTR